MYNKHLLKKFLPGGINDGGGWDFPSGTFRPFELGSGLANNIGSNTNGYPNTRQGKQDEIFAAAMGLGPKPSAIPKSSQNIPSNPFANITATGTASRADLDPETGTTVDAYGNPFQNWTPPEEQPKQPEESDLVIQERRAKRLGAFGGEEFVNVLNNVGIRYPVGIANNIQKNNQDFQLQLDNADPTKAVGSTNEIDEGDYVAYGQRVGMYRDPYSGQDRNSRATYGNFAGDQQISKYGGFMQEGGSSGYKVGQTVEMKPWELEEFLAAGGEVDYI